MGKPTGQEDEGREGERIQYVAHSDRLEGRSIMWQIVYLAPSADREEERGLGSLTLRSYLARLAFERSSAKAASALELVVTELIVKWTRHFYLRGVFPGSNSTMLNGIFKFCHPPYPILACQVAWGALSQLCVVPVSWHCVLHEQKCSQR